MAAGLAESYETAHTRLSLRYLAVTLSRLEMLAKGKLQGLSKASQYSADKSCFVTAARLGEGLGKILDSYVESVFGKSTDPQKKRIFEIWVKSK